jgi:predicted nucleic acid-binding protein
MLLAISDANVLIDLADSNLVVPDFVLTEITEDEQRKSVEKLVHSKNLSVLPASADDLLLMEGLLERHPALSFADCSVLILARRHNALVLTNDSRMRKVAERNGLTCHGTLWIIRQLVQETILTAERARRALLLLLESNSRLPKADCDRLLRELEQGPS